MFYARDTLQLDALFDIELGAGDLGHPKGTFIFAFPKIAADSSGLLHMVWGEPSVPARVPVIEWPPRITQIWTATFSRKGGWSQPLRIFEAPIMWWNDGNPGDLITTADGTLHLVVSALGSGRFGRLVYFRRDKNDWRATEVRIAGAASYASVAADARGNVVIGYIAADAGTRHDANSVFIVRSTDHGRSWGAPILVSRSGSTEASAIHTFLRSDGRLDLVWAQNLKGGWEPDVIRHTGSTNGGKTWSRAEDVGPRVPFWRLQATAGSCGELHVLYEDIRNPDSTRHLDYVRWRDGWSPPTHLFRGLHSISADIRLGDEGDVVAVWSARAIPAKRADPFTTVMSVLSTRRR
jgi:hypothetical protein